MRFWQKVYFSTLFLFLLLFDLCILMIVGSLYQNNMDMEKQKAGKDLSWLQWNMQRDLTAINGRDALTDTAAVQTVAGYEASFKGQDITLELWKNGNSLYSTTGFWQIGEKLGKLEEGKQELLYRIEDVNYYAVGVSLEDPLPGYRLVYVHKLAQLEEFLDHMRALCLSVGLVAAVILALILYELLKYLTGPLKKLAEASQVIAEGDYTHKIVTAGKDEFAELGGHFNHMADEIEKKVCMLQEESEKKQQLINNIAHEIRTPLTSIYGYAEYMQRAAVPEEEKYEVLSYIMKEASRLKNLGSELLMLEDIRGGGPVCQEIRIEELCASVRMLLARQLEEKKINLKVGWEVECLYGDSVLFQSLLQNLVENAVRASRPGGEVTLHFSREKDRSVIEVTDRGIGMEPEELVHITEPFYRTDKARSRAEGGAGIGLALCRQIVEAYQGTMEFASQKGRGTTVTITFTTPLQVG